MNDYTFKIAKSQMNYPVFARTYLFFWRILILLLRIRLILNLC